jgi:hypothetical protein
MRRSAALLFLAAVGCATGHPLMPTPNLYQHGADILRTR